MYTFIALVIPGLLYFLHKYDLFLGLTLTLPDQQGLHDRVVTVVCVQERFLERAAHGKVLLTLATGASGLQTNK